MRIHRKRIEHEIILIQQNYGETIDCTQCYNDICQVDTSNSKERNHHCIYIPNNDDIHEQFLVYFPDNFPFDACKLYLLKSGNFAHKIDYVMHLIQNYKRLQTLCNIYDAKCFMNHLDCPCCVSLGCHWNPSRRAIHMIREYQNFNSMQNEVKQKLLFYKLLNLYFTQHYDKNLKSVAFHILNYL